MTNTIDYYKNLNLDQPHQIQACVWEYSRYKKYQRHPGPYFDHRLTSRLRRSLWRLLNKVCCLIYKIGNHRFEKISDFIYFRIGFIWPEESCTYTFHKDAKTKGN